LGHFNFRKRKMKKEGYKLVSICNQLKMESSDCKMFVADIFDNELIYCNVHSVPSLN